MIQVRWNSKVMGKGVEGKEYWEGIKGQKESGEQGWDDQSIVDD